MVQRKEIQVTLIGMGLGNPATLTQEALDALRSGDGLIGSKRMLEQTEALGIRLPQCCVTQSKEIVEALQGRDWHRPCVLYSGDTGFHSGTRTLIPLLQDWGVSWKVIPGISSLQYFAAKLGAAWQTWQVVSAHGAFCDPVTALMAGQGKPVFFLTGGAQGPGMLCQQLTQVGLGHLQVTLGEALSYPEERVETYSASELAGRQCGPLSVLLVEGLPPKRQIRSQGLKDREFLRGKVPMTKEEVRAAALAKLEVREGGTYWDVGAGTGSVAVELALLASQGQIYAIDWKEEACELIRANRERFGVYHMTVLKAMAPQILPTLPPPDGVFIGGSRGQLGPILEEVLAKNPRARICVAAIAPETLGAAVTGMTGLGMEFEVSQITVARSQSVGGLHMMMGQNPIWLITGQKEGDEDGLSHTAGH